MKRNAKNLNEIIITDLNYKEIFLLSRLFASNMLDLALIFSTLDARRSISLLAIGVAIHANNRAIIIDWDSFIFSFFVHNNTDQISVTC